MNLPCTKISIQEVESTFFGSGKRQKDKAKAMCLECPIMDSCREDARNMQIMVFGNVVKATGVFGGVVFDNGKEVS